MNIYKIRKEMTIEKKLSLAISCFEKIKRDKKMMDDMVLRWKEKTNKWYYIFAPYGSIDIENYSEELFKEKDFESYYFKHLGREVLLRSGRYNRLEYQDIFNDIEYDYKRMMKNVADISTKYSYDDYVKLCDDIIFNFLIASGAFNWIGWNDEELQKQIIKELLTKEEK